MMRWAAVCGPRFGGPWNHKLQVDEPGSYVQVDMETVLKGDYVMCTLPDVGFINLNRTSLTSLF